METFKLEKMNCKSCGERKIKTNSGICVLCSKTNHDNEVKNAKFNWDTSLEIPSRTGIIDMI